MPPKLEASYKKIEKFLRFNLAGNLSHSTSEFYYRENPKISIIISLYNGEVYLKPILRSVQNQNFLNIEIIIVDDGSKDKSVEVVKELMKEDKRIKLLTNGINRGLFYTIARGVLNAKGKYVMTLDQDNLYATKDVFYKLYTEAEEHNLDLLGFSTIGTRVEVKDIPKNDFLNYIKTKIIKKPYIKKRFVVFEKKDESATFLVLYFIKRTLFVNSIKQLGDEFINRNIDAHDDTIFMFIMSRNALRLKHLKEIYYIYLIWPEEYSKPLEFQRTVKERERQIKNCYSYLTFIEVLIKFTENSDKFIAERCLYMWFFNQQNCRNNTNIINDAIRVLNLFLNNEYVTSDTKKDIYLYLNQTNQINQVNQADQINQVNQTNEIIQINQVINQTNQIIQINQTNEINQANQINQTNQINQAIQTNETNQINQPNQINVINPINQTNQENQINQTNQISQVNQVNQMNEINQTNQENQIKQLNQTKKIIKIIKKIKILKKIKINKGKNNQDNQTNLDNQINQTKQQI